MTVGDIKTSQNLPWVEKYRPTKLDDLVSHEEILKTINKFMTQNQLPHLLFYGPPGTGKTSTILACARQMYTPQQFSSMVLELNASDDRGIGIVRGQILSFASTRTIFKAGPKLIILDEADAMTNDAQNALRRRERASASLDLCVQSNGFSQSDLEKQRMSDSDEGEVLEKTIKITVVGESSTGKSTLCARYLGQTHASGSGTQGADLLTGTCLSLRPSVPVQMCDVSGAALGTSMLANYLFSSNIVLLVYDLTNLASFNKCEAWLLKVKEIFKSDGTPMPTIALFGNKADLEHHRAVRLSSVQRFASEHLLDNLKGSARTGENVNSTITSLIARVLGRTVPPQLMSRARPAMPPNISNGHANKDNHDSQQLIMHRKAFRNLQRKATSSVCTLQ